MGWNEAVDMIFNLFEFAENLIKVLGKLIIAMPKIFSLFTIFTDPAKVIKDVLSGLTSGFMLIVNTILDSVFGYGHKKTKSKSLISLENELISILGTRVQLKMKNEKSGSISIEYFTNEDLDRILDLIRSINN